MRNGNSAAPPLEQQVLVWLKESGLTRKYLPGEIVEKDAAYRMHYYDIDGEREPEGDLLRLLTPVKGFAALTQPSEDKPKYLNPKDKPPRVFFPPFPRTDWREHVRNPKERKLVAEGWKKAACATLYGMPCVGIYGCWGFRSKKHGMMLLPEFNDYALEDCDVYFIPDRDRKPEAIKTVIQASGVFAAQFMPDRGARVHVVELPLFEGKEKTGLDDFLVHYGRNGKDVAAAQRALHDLLEKTAVWKDWELTDIGNARRWVSMYGTQQFRHIEDGWYTYRNGCWRKDSALLQQETVKEMFEEMYRDAYDGGNSLHAASIKKLANAKSVRSLSELAKSDPHVASNRRAFDRNPLVVNCGNGTLELPANKDAALRLRPHSAADFLTKQVSVGYLPDAPCPVFLKALNFWTGEDKDLQRTIQQLLGISCTGVTREQVFIVLWGPGQSGKSTLIETARDILASYSKTLSSETLLVRKFGKDEERKLALLPGVRFATASETEEGGKLDENLIKLLTGEDKVTGRLLYNEQFDFTPEAKIWLRTNNRPTIRGIGNAIWRRVIALPFGVIVPEERKDRQLKDKLRTELEGIFAWMIRGYLDYAKNGLYIAPVVTAAVEEYRDEQDIVKHFFDFRVEFDPNKCPPGRIRKDYAYKVGREELYSEFASYVRMLSKHPITNKQFKDHLQERWKLQQRQLGSGDAQRWFWCGIRLKIGKR